MNETKINKEELYTEEDKKILANIACDYIGQLKRGFDSKDLATLDGRRLIDFINTLKILKSKI